MVGEGHQLGQPGNPSPTPGPRGGQRAPGCYTHPAPNHAAGGTVERSGGGTRKGSPGMRQWFKQVRSDLRTIIHYFWPCARSGDLVLLSIIWAGIGISTLAHDPERTLVVVEILGPWVRASLWIGSAVIAFVVATHGPGYIHGIDKWGFAALMVPVSIRGLSYWVAWGIGVLGVDSKYGSTDLWPNAVVCTAAAIHIYRLARRPELTDEVQTRARLFNSRKRRREPA
jgi:hypothetical protein